MFLKIALNFQVVSDLSAYSYIFDTSIYSVGRRSGKIAEMLIFWL
ncbi:MAG: hypothetical protein RLZZ203_1019 [Cyanobacteriota bacterium]